MTAGLVPEPEDERPDPTPWRTAATPGLSGAGRGGRKADPASPWNVPGLSYLVQDRIEASGLPPASAGPPPLNVLSVLSLVFTVPVPPAGLILGVIALLQIRRSGERGFTMAVIGVALGSVLTVLALAVLVLIVWALTSFPGPG
ncbi:DUF4190 domain-containing protein [Actinospica durhamensis]|uniref:DUF4190 domain-containing protein n=1 Tax=Actinospica durhamensis TaxID=1508375 RepID=A0A941EQL8_9ACTN|nr:DUF4190 domain-containing protein [Actinospica durhamensis]MBR7835326.1 DUF4190 domain-containing protein [Actinospica durhamensis]